MGCRCIFIMPITFYRFIANKFLKAEPMTHHVAESVEFAYAFDIHCNAFFPLFVTLHVIQILLFKSMSIISAATVCGYGKQYHSYLLSHYPTMVFVECSCQRLVVNCHITVHIHNLFRIFRLALLMLLCFSISICYL